MKRFKKVKVLLIEAAEAHQEIQRMLTYDLREFEEAVRINEKILSACSGLVTHYITKSFSEHLPKDEQGNPNMGK